MLHNAMGVLGSRYFSITKVYDPTSLVLREGGVSNFQKHYATFEWLLRNQPTMI